MRRSRSVSRTGPFTGSPRTRRASPGASGREGVTNAGETGYYGPQPPVGHGDHSYYFWVYALSRKVEGEPSSDDFLHEYAGDILEQNRLVGYYSR